jgi:tRNA threonylcarbamoyladenosine biosynthesis protein TsaB
MTLLLIDTSTARCAVFIRHGEKDWERTIEGARGQDARLAPMVQEALGSAKLSPKDITHIGVLVGPGAFTGVRIGVAFARGLGLALNVPVMGVNALDSFALTGADHAYSAGVCAIGRGELAYRLCRDGHLLGDYETGQEKDVIAALHDFGDGAPVVISGTAATQIADDVLSPTDISEVDLAIIADLMGAKALPGLDALPWYHRPPDAKLPGGVNP